MRIRHALVIPLVVLGMTGVPFAGERDRAEELKELSAVRKHIAVLIPEIETLEKQLEEQGDLQQHTKDAVRSWIVAAKALDSTADLFQVHLAEQILHWGKGCLEGLEAVRRGQPDPHGFITGEEDILSYEDIYNFHFVEPGVIASGSQPSEQGLQWLKQKGFTVLINFRKDDSERTLAERLGFRYYNLPIPDHLPPTREQMEEFVKIVAEARAKGEKVYHHCLRGVGRDQTVIACYLISKGVSAEEAIKTGRKEAPGWAADQGNALHGEDASAEEAARHTSPTPQFDFIRQWEQYLANKNERVK